MVWTSGWWDQGIGYASSKDLINWSKQKNIPVMEKFEGTKIRGHLSCFTIKNQAFYIFGLLRFGYVPEIPTSESEKGLNHRQFYVTTKDFQTFSDTKVYFNPGFSVIDGAMLEKDGSYYLL